MARVTIEDCLNLGYNKYSLSNLVTKRIIQLRKGEKPLVSTSNEEVVLALREIAAQKIIKVKKDNSIQSEDLFIETDNPPKEDSENTYDKQETLEKNL
jgi:DNA-directed RNA polymerase omega subunit